MQEEIISLRNEIRDLKTAQVRPSIMKLYSADFTVPANITKGFHKWTIHYKSSDNTTEPISYDNVFLFVLSFFDSSSRTQKIIVDVPTSTEIYAGKTFTIYSTQQISSITKD